MQITTNLFYAEAVSTQYGLIRGQRYAVQPDSANPSMFTVLQADGLVSRISKHLFVGFEKTNKPRVIASIGSF